MTQSIKKSDAVSGVVILLFCAVVLYFAKDIEGSPSAFPIVTLSSMAILALLLIVKALRGIVQEGKTLDKSESEPAGEVPSGVESEEASGSGAAGISAKSRIAVRMLIIGLLMITAIYLVAMDIIGFVISTPIYLFVMLLMLGMRRYVLMILISTLTTVVVFLIFRTVMYLSLPGGIFDPTEFIYRLLE
jgi:hypothetical protein